MTSRENDLLKKDTYSFANATYKGRTTGRFPLIFDINKRILKYISYLQNKDQLPRRTITGNVNGSSL